MILLVVSGLLAAMVFLSPPGKPSDEVALLPGPDGRASGVVVVQREGGRHVLDQPYATSRSGGAQVERSSEQEVRARYGAVLAALPARPAAFVLHFVSGKDELTEASRGELPKILAELRRRPVPDVAVIAHTDSVGEHEANGRGEREPLVATPDNTDEPRNRRVEISVR
jgi:outer membrane protein OmpA-like peptidoglycan-associated protein